MHLYRRNFWRPQSFQMIDGFRYGITVQKVNDYRIKHDMFLDHILLL